MRYALLYTVTDRLRDKVIMTPALSTHSRRRLVRFISTVNAAQSDSLSYYSSHPREPGLLLTEDGLGAYDKCVRDDNPTAQSMIERP